MITFFSNFIDFSGGSVQYSLYKISTCARMLIFGPIWAHFENQLGDSILIIMIVTLTLALLRCFNFLLLVRVADGFDALTPLLGFFEKLRVSA